MPAPAPYNPSTPGEVAYALATPADAPAVAALVARVWTRFFGHSVSADDLAEHLATSLHPDTIGAELARGDMAFVVATVARGGGDGEDGEDGGDGGDGGDTPADDDNNARSTHLVPAITVTPSPSPSPRPYGDEDSDATDAPDPASPLVVGVAQIVAGSAEPCLTHPDPVELRRLYVDQTQHGKGVADALVAHAAALAAERFAARALWLGVWEDNPRARRFYARLGFEDVGEHEFVVGGAVRRDVVMERALGALRA
ncbi:hypothetical protein Q8F55_005313 [Vanrija albida]|uniref:N-acetyltransferase domain-containing protein n=1 Tax=Vanrija albida TaxID=181172 RepID=A0ABR3Q1G1_9TREE